MKKKEFKSSSKRVLDLMINSIYTNKEIFLRELISNASDAIDKLAFEKSKDAKLNINPSDFKIFISVNKSDRTITITDNGIGMDEEELEVAMRYGSKSSLEARDESDLGRFGLGLKMASLSQCRCLTVATKKDGKIHVYKQMHYCICAKIAYV